MEHGVEMAGGYLPLSNIEASEQDTGKRFKTGNVNNSGYTCTGYL